MKSKIRKEVEKIKKSMGYEERSVKNFLDFINWFYISKFQFLSENFIREFKDKVDWYWISEYQKLSESFIREFKDKVNWGNIVEKQRISKDFIYEMLDYIKKPDFYKGIPFNFCIENNLITHKYIEDREKIHNRFELLDL